MNTKKSNIFEINEESSGQRLDNFLIKQLKNAPKSLIYKLVRSGQVRVNSGRKQVSYRIVKDDIIRIPPYLIKDERISQEILQDPNSFVEYENEKFLLINKPSGIAVHSGTNQKFDFLTSLRSVSQNKELSLVHRLDKSTSGCLLVSKNYKSASYLGKQFLAGNVKKKYYALLLGTLDRDVIEIESKISKDVFEKKMTLDNIKGKYAYTKIKLLKRFKSYSYVEIEIETGRTHQIRLHAASLGHPIAGDIKYNNQNHRENNKKINLRRLFLHSFYLSFFYDEQYEFILDLPIELKEVLSILKTYND
tara:strand:- start:6054 stop:6971 length:918 start_codon:yes stop_codon:yes gene_type:complete